MTAKHGRNINDADTRERVYVLTRMPTECADTSSADCGVRADPGYGIRPGYPDHLATDVGTEVAE